MPLFKRKDAKKEEPVREAPRHTEPMEAAPPPAAPPPQVTPTEAPKEEAPKTIEQELAGLEDELATVRPTTQDEAADEEVRELGTLMKGESAMPGAPQPPVEREQALDELAGPEAHVVKMAKKVVLLGDPAVGKTSLIKKYVQDVFDDRYLNTIGAKVMKKNLGVHKPATGEIVDLKLILWDIAGQESFATVKKAYYKGASGALVACDSTRRETMEHVHHWIENLFDVSGVIPFIIIVNKSDLEKEAAFTLDEVRKEFQPYEAPVFATSAKTGFNVELVFHELGKGMTEGGKKDAKDA